MTLFLPQLEVYLVVSDYIKFFFVLFFPLPLVFSIFCQIVYLICMIIPYIFPFLTVQADLCSFSDAVEPNLRFLAMLAGPFYPILHVVYERYVQLS